MASGISTLDYVSHGRAGWRPQISARVAEAAHVGRRTLPENTAETRASGAVAAASAELFAEAADAVEVVRRLWDSWEDDAVIRTSRRAASSIATSSTTSTSRASSSA